LGQKGGKAITKKKKEIVPFSGRKKNLVKKGEGRGENVLDFCWGGGGGGGPLYKRKKGGEGTNREKKKEGGRGERIPHQVRGGEKKKSPPRLQNSMGGRGKGGQL